MSRVVLMRALPAIALITCALATRPARADTELLVLPLGNDAKVVKAAVAKAKLGTVATTAVEETCASDPGCLTKTGGDAGAHRVLAVAVNGRDVAVTLVDANLKLLLATRDLSIPRHTMARKLGPTLAKFVSDAVADKAKALIAEGNQHFNAGETQPALDKYELAFRVRSLAVYQLNIAECHRKLGEFREAIASYEAYLAGVPRAQNREAIEATLAETKQQLADQQAQEQQREQDRQASEQKQADDARKAKAARDAETERTTAERTKAKQATVDDARVKEPAYDRHPARAWMLVTTGLGLAAGGAGAYFMLQAHDAQGRFDAIGCGDPKVPLDTMHVNECFSSRDRADRDGLLGKVLIGSGGALAVASLIVLVADPGHVEPPRRTSLRVTHNAVSFVVRW